MWAIISNNCWGAGLYQGMSLPYNTPTVGLWFEADDYLSFLRDLRVNLSKPLRFKAEAERGGLAYPIGILGDGIAIHFMHYRSEAEARTKWEARAARIPASDDELYVKICDRDGFGLSHLEAFDALPFRNKVGFIKRGRFDVSGAGWAVEIDTPEPCVPDGLRLWDMTNTSGSFDPRRWVGAAS